MSSRTAHPGGAYNEGPLQDGDDEGLPAGQSAVCPPGRVSAVADVVRRHDLLVVADELHADLVYRPHRRLPLAAPTPEMARRAVTMTSASKAFNRPGCMVRSSMPRRAVAAGSRRPVHRA
ncbi:aminotransferase class I/II-fold pyridoxal phosphate-dependent enzyme [Streptomyces cyaneus]|uniref:aminotransferase class I/II-fold pyridoxal phosphate-dependent enzyme n=1 Tax=Streptomyces cyaneus TaxID=1904 RepID=UPI000FF89077|nr:aminotransferase class I/II-fold pyridoxal phosphate-dependent enzyme [Streptomyces cyaneus]